VSAQATLVCAKVIRIGAALSICDGRRGDLGSQPISPCGVATPGLSGCVVRRVSNYYRHTVYLNVPRRRRDVPHPRSGRSYVQASHIGGCYSFRLRFWNMDIDQEPVVSLRDSGCNRELDSDISGFGQGRDVTGNSLYDLDYCGFDIKPCSMGLRVAAIKSNEAATGGCHAA